MVASEAERMKKVAIGSHLSVKKGAASFQKLIEVR